MTADTVKLFIFIFLLVMKACIQTYSNPDIEKRNLQRENPEDEHYSTPLVKALQDLARFEQDIPMVTYAYEQNHIRRTRNLAKYEVSDDKVMDRRLVIQHIPFVIPIENFFKNVDYQINKYLYGTKPQRKIQWKQNKRRDQLKQMRKEVVSTSTIQSQQMQSTTWPVTRWIRSTLTTKDGVITPLPPLIMTKSAPKRVSKMETQYITIPYSAIPFSAIPFNITKILDPETKSLPNKVITTELPRIPEAARTNTTAALIASNFSRINSSVYVERMLLIHRKFAEALDKFERKYYNATYGKLSSISPPDRRENGISFVESGFFLFLILNALSMEVDNKSRLEIDNCLGLDDISNSDKIGTIKLILDNLPSSSDVIKFRWSTRLVVSNNWKPDHGTGEALRLSLERFSTNETTEQLMKKLNKMVEQDSAGAMRHTFEEDELLGARAVLIHTMYVRARWRAAPTLLNGTHPFRDADGAPPRTTRMLRVNDIVRYADLTDWDAQVVEIAYATPGLSLLVLVPRGRSLRALSERAAAVSVRDIIAKMRPLRAAVTLPIYTLRMTLLLPNKFQAMGITRLVAPSNDNKAGELRLSHAVQRLMFWAEAGRNAFKDDGIEWDHKPDLEIMVDRPYLFFVRWRNVTVMNGNFVL